MLTTHNPIVLDGLDYETIGSAFSAWKGVAVVQRHSD
jgi:hypothetical protein